MLKYFPSLLAALTLAAGAGTAAAQDKDKPAFKLGVVGSAGLGRDRSRPHSGRRLGGDRPARLRTRRRRASSGSARPGGGLRGQ